MWTGECKKCGKCCIEDINWLPYKDTDGKNMALDWAQRRGYKIKQVGKEVIQANFEHKCPQLSDDNMCKIYSQRPTWCKNFPNGWESFADLDPNKVIPEDCGFTWIPD